MPEMYDEYYRVVYLLSPTSNHNRGRALRKILLVVYLLSPTSNHNFRYNSKSYLWLYIF